MASPTGQLPRPSRSLKGCVAIISGAGNQGTGIGNGRAISILLAEDGASVVCVDRDLEAAKVTASMIQEEGKGRAIALYADVTKDTDCAKAVATALKEFGRVDILVNNVGIIGAKGTAVEVDKEEWSASLEINVSSMMLMAKHTIPAMSQNEPDSGGIRGAIVNMGSVSGLQGGTPSLLYPTSKGAVVNMTRAMAAHHAKAGIRVNCVCPGRPTLTTNHILITNTDTNSGPMCCRDAVYADDVRWQGRDDRRYAGSPSEAKSATDRGECMGRRRGRAISLGQGGEMGDGDRHDRRCWSNVCLDA